MNNPLTDMLAEAQRTQPHQDFKRDGFDDPIRIRKPAASLRTLSLKNSFMPALIGQDGTTLTAAPIANMAGEKIPMSAAIIANSRVAKAGAHIIIRPDQTRAIAMGQRGGVALANQVGHFVTVEAAQFSFVPDEEEVPVSLIPVSRAKLNWETAQSIGVRFHLNHKTQKDIGNDQYAAELMVAITIGLARAADRMILEAINATTPAAFTLGAAAAQGIAAHELRGIVGVSGIGAAFRNDGTLTAAGVSAELTGDMGGTLIGAFNRCAIAIHEDVSVLAERTSAAGALDVTCWCSMIALLPDSQKFWSVA